MVVGSFVVAAIVCGLVCLFCGLFVLAAVLGYIGCALIWLLSLWCLLLDRFVLWFIWGCFLFELCLVD